MEIWKYVGHDKRTRSSLMPGRPNGPYHNRGVGLWQSGRSAIEWTDQLEFGWNAEGKAEVWVDDGR